MMASQDVTQLKSHIVQALRVLLGEGLIEKAYGHISVRIPDSDRCCIVGHIHGITRTLDSITVEDILVIDMDGNVQEGQLEPPGEFPIHTEIYKRRPDVGAVVHCHPKSPVALSIAGECVLPVTMRGAIFAPEVPTFSDPTQIDTSEKGEGVAEVLSDNRAVVLRGHGVVVVGENLVEACVATVDLEEVAQLQLAAYSSGREPQVIEGSYMSGGVIAGLEDEFFSGPWHYYLAKYSEKSN